MTSELWMDGTSTDPALSISTTTEGGPVSEVQRIGFSADEYLYDGTFTLTFDGETTGDLYYNASAATVQAALDALPNIAPGDIVVTKLQNSSSNQEWQLVFSGSLAGTNVSQITVNSMVMGMMSVSTTQTTDTQGSGGGGEVQVVTLSNATGGAFRLALGGEATGPLAFDASAATIEAALEGLSTVDDVTVTGSAGGPWTVTFGGTQAGVNMPQIEGDASTARNGTVDRTLSYSYNAGGQLVHAYDPAAEYVYQYDKLGRLTTEYQVLAGLTPEIELQREYDALGNRTKLQASIGGTADLKNVYAYDALSRLTSITQQGASGGNSVAEKRVDFTYDASGLFQSITRYADVAATLEVATTDYAYDGIGRLLSLTHSDPSSVALAGYGYTYDAASRITSIDSMIDGLTNYTHDDTDQLTGANHTSQADETYAYDANGNRTMTGYSVGDNNQLLSDGTYTYEYDEEGNRTAKETIATGEREEYEWDHRNRLTKITFKDSMGVVVKTVEQSYDVFNRWVRRQVDDDGAGLNAATDTFFAYDVDQILLEFDGGAAADLSNRYLWGPAVDQILADEQVTSLSSAGNILWPLTDHLNTVRDIADRDESTGNATVTNHVVYDSFGNVVGETNASVDVLFGFTGRPFDEAGGLQNNLNRWYDPATGQWLSQDPVGFLAGDLNLNRYVSNSPTARLDPLGLMEYGSPEWIDWFYRWKAIKTDRGLMGEARKYHYDRLTEMAARMKEAVEARANCEYGDLPTEEARQRAFLDLWKKEKQQDSERYSKHGTIGAAPGSFEHQLMRQIEVEEALIAHGDDDWATRTVILFLLPAGANPFPVNFDNTVGALGAGAQASSSVKNSAASVKRSVPIIPGTGSGPIIRPGPNSPVPGPPRRSPIKPGTGSEPIIKPGAHSPVPGPSERLQTTQGVSKSSKSGPNPCGVPGATKSIKSTLDALPGKIGKTGPIKEVPDAKALAELFDSLSSGGSTVASGTYPGVVKKLPDGTIVRSRPGSKSGGATLDITMPDGTIIKVHIK